MGGYLGADLDKAIYKKAEPRDRLSAGEWESLKKRYGSKCAMRKCAGVPLEQGHLRAQSKGGKDIVPMCPTCHSIYDGGKATDADLASLQISRSLYSRYVPKKAAKRKDALQEFISG